MKCAGFSIALMILMLGNVNAEVITPNSNVSNDCGGKINKNDVMVLDLESFGGDVESAKEFVIQHAGEFELTSKTPELIKTKWQGKWYSRKSAIKRATTESASRGCDLLLVLNAGTENVGTAYYNSWNGSINTNGNASGSGWSTGSNIKKGGAVVLMGDRG